ncbi:MAG: hypothetical protein RL242_169 [Pseudomonadota bacterium]
MWSYFWKLLFGGPQENATSTSTTTTSTASQSSAESKTIKLERNDQESGVREVPSSSIENAQTASISETPSEEKSEVQESSSVPSEGTTSVEIETKSAAKVEHKDNDTSQAVEELPDWEIGFGENFPLTGWNLEDSTRIPGLILFSPRSLPLAAWLSGLELGYLQYSTDPRPIIRLETGASDSWVVANVTDAISEKEAQGFEAAKKQAGNIDFLAIQDSPESETFAGFWLLQETALC